MAYENQRKRFRTLSDSSPDDDPQENLRRPPKRFASSQPAIQNRESVIVSPSNSKNANTSMPLVQKDSESSSEESAPDVYKKLMKSKPAEKPVFGSVAQKMMEKMGFKQGGGLGKNQQGLTAPIEASTQRGRRGLGLQLKGLEAESIEWDSSQEIIEVEETVEWLPSCDLPPPSIDELRDWILEGSKKLTIEDEITFCHPKTLEQVLQCKTVFDMLEPEELRNARSRSNPFETIRGAFFLNRAAMKMANMDAVFDFMFTDPKCENEQPTVGPNDLLYFADVCAGPGGFSEYVLWRKKWECKGFGFTLKGAHDFKVEDFYAGPSENFDTHYGAGGQHGDGDVYRPDNIREFRKYVLSQTENQGVHFMMADGGFSVEGQENLQEILSKRLYLCQCLVALSIVRPGGHFVCKLFDVFTPFSAGLIYLMYRAFKSVCIHKPNTSRPANSERYIVCKWKRDDVKDIENYMFEVNCRLEQLSSAASKEDILEIVPLEILTSDSSFYDYLVKSNDLLGQKQIVNLAKIAAFCKDATLREDRQTELRKQCLDFWRIPDKARTAPPKASFMDKSREYFGNSGPTPAGIVNLTSTRDLEESVKSAYDWRCIVSGLDTKSTQRTFFLGLGRRQVYTWERSKWTKVNLATVELPRDTLVYGELLQEMRGESRSQRRIYALHIIDAMFLAGTDISNLHYVERHEKCKKFAKAMNKPSKTELAPVRAKELFRMEEIEQIFHRLELRVMKNGEERLVFCLDDEENHVYHPEGIIFYRTTKDPWMQALSRKSGKKYWYNAKTRSSVYEVPRESIAEFAYCHKNLLGWWWEPGVILHEAQEEKWKKFQQPRRSDVLHRHDIIGYVHTFTSKT